MASEEQIEILIASTAAMVPYTSVEKIEAVADAFARQFGGTPYDDLSGAVDQWLNNHGDKAPEALPTPGMIWAIMKRANTANDRGADRRRFVPASSEFKAERRRVWREAELTFDAFDPADQAKQARRRDKDLRHVHDDRDPETLDWGKAHPGGVFTPCAKCVALRARRAERFEVIATMPEPGEGASKPCRCDGSGWVDTAEVVGSLAEPGFDRDLVRVVFPCPQCRREQFEAWRDGDAA